MLCGVRASWSLAVLLLSCGPRGSAPLARAGGAWDDGVGVLARSSVQLVYDGAGDDEAGPVLGDERYQRTYDYDPLASYGYGSFGYGGFGYAGFGYGGGLGYATRQHRVEPPPYDPRSGGNLGAIEGSVAWNADAGVAWPADCRLARTARAGAPVVGAVVYLDKVTAGRAMDGRTGGVLTATACGLAPAVQVVGPLPAGVVVESAAPQLSRLAITAGGRELLELDPGGRLELPLARPGVMSIDLVGGAPAWVFGEAHPYYELTDERGRFALDRVPAGPHTLVIWSPPLVTSVGPDGPVWSAPTIERRTIVVPVDGLATVQAGLQPAR